MTNNTKEKPSLSSPLKGQERLGEPEQLGRYTISKRHNERVAAYMVAHHPELRKEIKDLESCGSWLLFNYFYTINKHKLAGGFSCKKHLLCAACALRRASALVCAYEQRYRCLLEENPHLVPVLITYTVKNGPDIAERYQHLAKAQQYMLLCRRVALSNSTSRGRSKDTILKHVYASAGSYEFKRGKKSGEWHPHIHEVALIDSRDFQFVEEKRIRTAYFDGIQQQVVRTVQVPSELRSQLCKEWWMATGDSFVVDVVRLFNRPASEEPVERSAAEKACAEQDQGQEQDDTLFSGLCEAFKYALKMSSLAPADQIEAYLVLKGKRLLYSYGELRKVNLPEHSADDVHGLADLPRIQVLYRWAHSHGYLLGGVLEGASMTPLILKKKKPKLTPRVKALEDFDADIREWIGSVA